MTLLVGVLCNNGVVIAADRQAQHGAMGVQTVGQSVTKVSIVGQEALFAISGRVGLGQQLEAIIQQNHQAFRQQNYHTIIRPLQAGFRQIVDPALNTARIAAGTYGPQAAMEDAICGCLLATRFRDGVKLVEISPQVAVESLTPELPFITMGSGKPSADPFLGFLRKVFWPDRPPTVVEGALAAYWTVQHSIEMKVHGVGFTPDVFTLEIDGNNVRATQLDAAHLKEHQDFINAAQKMLQSMQQTMANPAAPGEPPPQEPPVMNH